MKYLKQIIGYLSNNAELGVEYIRNSREDDPVLTLYTDSDHASNPIHQRSHVGFAIYHYNHIVAWANKDTSLVCQSSTEAEIQGLIYGSNEALALSNFLNFLYDTDDFATQYPIHVYVDNMSTIAISEQPNFRG